MHYACKANSTSLLRLMLAAAPEAAAAQDERGCTPLFTAAAEGCSSAVELLLAAAPSTAVAEDHLGRIPLHMAAAAGCDLTIKQLLTAAPGAAAARVEYTDETPLHFAAWAGCASAVELLLKADPDMAAAKDYWGRIPLHKAFSPAVAQTLIAAAGAHACSAEDDQGATPVDVAVWEGRTAVAAYILQTLAPSQALSCLAATGERGLPFFADVVEAHPDLTAEQWLQVPVSCTGLGRALPTALAHSTAAARQLVVRLTEADRQRLHAFAQALLPFLAHVQGRTGVYLPASLVGRIVSMFDS